MSLILIKEDGTGRADANSYADVADCDAYHEGHLYATVWTAATADKKSAALVMASRVIDAQMQFNGCKAAELQALQWPRANCPDPDSSSLVWRAWSILVRRNDYLASDRVPAPVVSATCELARELLVQDRTAAPPGEGLWSDWTATGGTRYSQTSPRPVLPRLVQAMLCKHGSILNARSGVVRLVRA